MLVIKTTLLFLALMHMGPDESKKPYVLSYIDQYKFVAIDEMERSGIPASIILAQGILESNAGVSNLAIQSNNHFGIKCKSYWTGSAYYHPDDDRDAEGKIIPSCFRRYDSVEASYADHSDFLMNTLHYRPLFVYDKTEYEQWAKGLQVCGYASDPAYAEKLIRTINLYNLHEFDYYTVQYIEVSKINTTDGLIVSPE
jgi:flagellum-specific peptidoglycan hydrolase FlgJ